MECEVKYRPIIWKTDAQDRKAMLQAYLGGDGLCPACLRDGIQIAIEERFGGTP